ncbi:ThiJ/PfpI family protein [Colletotrichum simmondsii]|uniref:ThiJ/PfpI family protein n=1 Tax=Colletotrichum simmondsii TaxID=703756 RepID=A0A135RRD5_9PEZI|nr:ThiJ/PfpI family protein [Colletotrichum simmondsii]
MSTRPKLLVVLTSQDIMPTRENFRTGWYLPEFVHPYNALAPHVDLVVASPKGGVAPIDPYSIEDSKNDGECQRFLKEQKDLWEKTETLSSFFGRSSEFAGVFYVGGHGPMFDLAVDPISHSIIREFYEAGQIVSAVCHGPGALVNVKLTNGEYLVKDNEVTGFSNAEEDAYSFTDAMPFLLETELKNHGGSENISAEQKVIARRSRVLHAQNHPASLELSWDTRARCAFFSTYIQGFTRSMGEIAYHYRNSKTLDHISASVEAVSLAFMAAQLASPNLLLLASSSYVTAIQRLNHALSSLNPGEAEKALQTILLLDMYEKLVHRDPAQSQSWLSHAQGGLSLLGARETSIVSTPTGCQVAARLVTAVTVSCATVGDKVPPELTNVRRNIGYRVKSVKWTFLGVLAQVVNLKSDIIHGRVSTLELLVKAKGLDERIDALDKARPPSWKPKTIQVTADQRILGCFYDIYPDHYITQVSNAICTIRLILYHLIKTYVPEESRPKEYTFHGTSRDSVNQMCASVPQFILPGIHETNSLPFSPVQQLHCSTFLAPLYLINQVSEDKKVKAWVQRCLKFMWESGGFKSAKEILHVTQTAPDLDYWTVFAMTGSYALGA